MESATACSINTVPALKYIEQVKERVSPDDYRKFLEILMEYWTKQRSVDELHGQMKLLFGNDASLLEAFERFLPKSEAGEGTKEESH